jgi:hypothetical protein
MNKKIIFLALAAILIAVGILWVAFPHLKESLASSKNAHTTPNLKAIAPAREIPVQVEAQVRQAEAERQFRLQHINELSKLVFFGRVFDDHGAIVQGAKIIVSPSINGPNATWEKVSDGNGTFSVLAKEPKFTIEVSKDGYQTVKASTGHFTYGQGKAPSSPNPSQPAIFVLRKVSYSSVQ